MSNEKMNYESNDEYNDVIRRLEKDKDYSYMIDIENVKK